jgi:hypothetical protein
LEEFDTSNKQKLYREKRDSSPTHLVHEKFK